MTARLWSFSSKLPQQRVEALLSYQSFETVLALLSSATVISFAWEPFRKEVLHGCNRACFLIETTPQVYDAFFNSPVGLRAQYAISPTHGEAANRRLLASLESRLHGFKRESVLPEAETIHWSLCAPEAKIWIHEKEVEMQLCGDEPEILYPPWARCSESGVGLLAPCGTKLEVMGGWLNSSVVVVPNPEKATRSRDIHTCGFA